MRRNELTGAQWERLAHLAPSRYSRRRGRLCHDHRRVNERHQPAFDRERYRARNRVERLINRLKQFRCGATPYEKLSEQNMAMVTLAAIALWL
jgi:transposase